MRRLPTALFLLALLASTATAGATGTSPPDDRAVAAFLRGGDPAPAREAAARLDAECGRSGQAADCYRAAHAHWIAAVLALGGGRDAAVESLVGCGVRLAPLLADPAWAAEAKALQSGCHGLTIALNPMKGMTLGPESARLIDEALSAAPDNPRVHYFAAMRLARTPPAWGGDPVKALEHALRARTLAEAIPADAMPGWGAAEAAHLVAELEAKRGAAGKP
jgi:hypothetical protein